jgi:hypothetical protein
MNKILLIIVGSIIFFLILVVLVFFRKPYIAVRKPIHAKGYFTVYSLSSAGILDRKISEDIKNCDDISKIKDFLDQIIEFELDEKILFDFITIIDHGYMRIQNVKAADEGMIFIQFKDGHIEQYEVIITYAFLRGSNYRGMEIKVNERELNDFIKKIIADNYPDNATTLPYDDSHR